MMHTINKILMIVPRNKYININHKVKQDILHNRENETKLQYYSLYYTSALYYEYILMRKPI